jgi:type IV pilus assembly protein PilQ
MKTNWSALRFGCLLLAGAALVVLPTRAQIAQETPGSAAARAPYISSVTVSHVGQQTTVRISGSRDLRFRASRLSRPPRLVLDFAGTKLDVPRNAVRSEYAPVAGVRMGHPYPGRSRVVIDLTKFTPYHVQTDGSNLTISFHAAGSEPSSSSIQAPARGIPPVVSVPPMPLPAWLTRADLAFAMPVPQPPAPETADRTAKADKADKAETAEPDPAAPQTDGTAVKKYTGEPISVNLKDVDLKDFFRLIHEISGLNVVLDPSVKGSVTLVLDNVPWDQALDIVLENNGLAKELDGNVLRIVTQDTLKREAEEKRDVAKAQEEALEVVTATRVLSYAKADTLVPTIKKFLSPRGDVIADSRSNMLIIRDIPSSIPKVDNLIRQLDRKGQQVEIDARVVAASRAFARDIGTQFGFATTAGNTVLGGLTGAANFASPVGHIVPPPLVEAGTSPAQMPLVSNLGAVSPNSGITFSTQGRNYAIDFILSMMEAKGVGKVLSEPKGVIQNNQTLTVKQGTKVPIQTTINNTISVQYVDAVLELQVTPQITADGTVLMNVTVENTQIDQGIPRVQGIPALDTQSTETKVLINDGGTVVIGGVVTSSQRTDISQVPLVGSVPLIGHLFKRTSVNVQSQELLFFVTPRILPG